MDAVHLYRATFRPSKEWEKPYLMLGINVICAATDGEARRQFTSVQQSFTNLRRGTPGQIPPPIDDIETYWSPQEKAMASHMLAVTAVGSPETVLRGLQNFVDVMRPDELIMTAHLYDHRARVESFERVAGLRERVTVPREEVAARS